MHHTSLIATIVAGLGLAFVFGAIANRLKLPVLVGYLLAGVLVGPFTPGYVADQELAPQLAEIGVILLMFGVGLHFSLKDLMAVRNIAIPGAVVQISAATVMGLGLALALGWGVGAGVVFGLALSVASTVVLLRALQERRLIETGRGKIAVGWLIVEDLAMVLALVLLPALSGVLGGETPSQGGSVLGAFAMTIGKVVAFVAFMLIVGRRVIPWILHRIAHTGSRELFRLAVLAIALGVAFGSAALFGVSFALGAFFAGMIMAESELSQQAANETLPLRDAFAVLFFVSIGMLFDPMVLLREPLSVLATLLIIVVGKSIAALIIVRAFKRPMSTALTISASLAQIGEFSFILAGLGVSLKLLPEDGRDLILAGAILSILMNPLLFAILDRVLPGMIAKEAKARGEPPPTSAAAQPHAVLVGYGRVGKAVADGLKGRTPLVVIEDDVERAEDLRKAGFETVSGNAVKPEVLLKAGLDKATHLFVAVPNPFEAARIIEQARAANPKALIVARAYTDADVALLKQMGAAHALIGEEEIARGMLARAPRKPSPAAAGGH